MSETKPLLWYNGATRRFEWHGPYRLRELPREARFYWNPDAKCWMTTSIQHASQLIEHADEKTAAFLIAHRQDKAVQKLSRSQRKLAKLMNS